MAATSSVATAKLEDVPIWAPITSLEERDVTAWLGNDLQNEAFAKIYALRDKVLELGSGDFNYVWHFMQTSDHFYYMATKWLSDGDVHSYFNPYDSAYEAFINYMNVLSDFEIEVDKALEVKRNNVADAVVVEATPAKKPVVRKAAAKKPAATAKKATATKTTVAKKAPAKRATKKSE